MKYRIKPECYDMWFGKDTPDPDYIVTETEVHNLAHKWDVTIEDLLYQLIPIEEEDTPMEKTVYTVLIEADDGIHIFRKAISDPTGEYEDFEYAMQNKADELEGEMFGPYCDDDIVEDVTIDN